MNVHALPQPRPTRDTETLDALYDLDGPIHDALAMSEIAIQIVSRVLERGVDDKDRRFDISAREVERIIFSVSDVSRRLYELTQAFEKATCAT